MSNPSEIFVTGIASSAGGITPLMDVIAQAVCHESMAFVLVPHLSRDHESALPEILKRVSELKILTIEDDMEIEPCHLYVLPPGFYARVENNRLVLDERPDHGPNQSANVLFKSLAKFYRQNAIGVVLSGAGVGADGSEGVVAIKDAGGYTYAQDPQTALFPQMPKAAIHTGKVDFVLEPDAIGKDLGKLIWR